MIENFDALEWDISEIPVGSSTPDEFFELSYPATADCPVCGEQIEGTAQFWSRDEDMSGAWLERVDYEPCECQDREEEDLDEDDYEEDEPFIIN